MIRHRIILVLAAAALAIAAAAAAPGQAQAVSFVDKQVQAGSLLVQKYIDDYGVVHQFTYPSKSMVKKGGGLTAPIWPANPWTGKIMGQGTARGTYTYTLAADGHSYKLTVHLSRGNYPLKGGMPKWLKTERNTAAKQNTLLLQRYLDAYKVTHGVFPSDLSKAAFAGYDWPLNPWTGADMVAGTALGDYSYTLNSASLYTLKVRLTSGWSTEYHPVSVMSRLTVTPGG